MEIVSIARRFRGPASSGNGGYTCGLVARLVGGDAVEVTLRSPPPLEVPFTVSRDGDRVTLAHEGTLIAEGAQAPVEIEVPSPPSFEEARAVAQPVPNHPLAECFVCGPARTAGDGLRLFPARVGERALIAAPLVLEAPSIELVWAALDCPSGIALWALAGWEGVILLGRMAARISTPLVPGAPHVVIGWVRSLEGRKGHTGSAIFDESGRAIAVARATWIRPK
jgi:hypothetical protein